MDYIKLAKILSYLGIIPFAVLSLANLLDYNYIFELKTYGALILGFLGGINWGVSLNKKNNKILLISVVNILLCWFFMIIVDDLSFLIILMVLFLLQLIIDYKIFRSDSYEKWFVSLRLTITLIVLFFISISVIALF